MLLLLWRVVFLPLLLLLSGTSYGAEVHVKSADDLITFSNDVNSGTNYLGTTVFLDNDLDFTGKETMEPIAKNWSYSFLGVLDGKGHVIRNLEMKVNSSDCVGLFGHSDAMEARNLVIDSTCSIEDFQVKNLECSYIGSLIGFFHSESVDCSVEGIVNMAGLTFSGDIPTDLHLGGIVGVAWSDSGNILIRNCANYGTLTHRGTVGGYCDIGGIVGQIIADTKYLQNCINYGSIRHTGSTISEKCIGGIVGYIQNYANDESVVENCLSAGVIELTNKTNGYVGGIAGGIDTASSTVSITHCFWTNDMECSAAYGFNISIPNVSDSSLVELNTTTLNELNDYAERNGWSKTTAFHLNGGKINNLTQDTLIVTEYHFPDPVKGDKTFICWCEDIYCNVKYNTTNPSGASDVYAIWDRSTLTFNFGNRSSSTRTVQFNETIEYPEDMRREGYTFVGWGPRPERMPGADLTIVALWDEAPVISSSSIESSSSSSVSISSSYSSARSEKPIINITNPTRFVKIAFDTKYMTEEEAEEAIKPFTNDKSFVITRFEDNGNEFIVEFTDEEAAEGFFRNINKASGSSKDPFKRVEFVDGYGCSYSLLYTPMVLFSILIL